MSYRRKTKDLDELLALFALLSIWICAIISPKNQAVPAADYQSGACRPVLIIDPGHGGMDGGASAPDGVKESEINLSIALRLRDLSALMGLPVRMTRESEELDYPPEITSIAERKRWDTRRRCEEINAINDGFLISIHQNYYPSSAPHGAQVLYSPGVDSRLWAQRAQSELSASLCPNHRRLAVPAEENIYIMNHIQCPAILVECGFLSNPGEAQALQDAGYQLRLAAILANCALELTEEHII